MKARKIFLGIRIPKDVAKRLWTRIEPYASLPLRMTKEANFHVTLLFIGFRGDEDIALVVRQLESFCSTVEAFDVTLTDIKLMPEEGKNARSMLWFVGDEDENLRMLHNGVREALDIAVAEKQSFRPHITLARVRKEKWSELETQPEVASSWRVSIPVSSIVLFESVFIKGTGLRYETLEEFPLGE